MCLSVRGVIHGSNTCPAVAHRFGYPKGEPVVGPQIIDVHVTQTNLGSKDGSTPDTKAAQAQGLATAAAEPTMVLYTVCPCQGSKADPA